MSAIKYGDNRLLLGGFCKRGPHVEAIRFDLYSDTQVAFTDMPYDQVVELRDQLSSFINDHAQAAGRGMLNHLSSIVNDEQLTPTERLAMLAEHFTD